MSRSWLVLTDGFLQETAAKTAHGVIRYARDPIAAVVDERHAGRNLAEVMPELGRDAPIVAGVKEGLAFQPTSLLLGVATPGGWLPDHWRPMLLEAIDAGLEIVNGLHRFLHDDKELVKAARARRATLWDVRQVPSSIPLFSGRTLRSPHRVVHTVGSDCSVGKMTVSVELTRAARAAGFSAEFVATGQTGIMIAGRGIAIDRVVSDFVAGAAEQLVIDSHPSSDVLVVEGQGSLWHPAYSGVTLGLLHGCTPHVLVLCHRAGHTAIDEPPYTSLPPLPEMIETYQAMASTLRPARVACVALNTNGLTDAEARREIATIESDTGLPAGDVLRGEASKLWEAVAGVLPDRP